MGRLIVFDALFFLTPFAIYALWLMITRGSLSNIADWQAKTIAWLAAGGAAMMIVVILVFIQFQGSPIDGTYIPPHLDEDGNIVEGHFE